MARCLRCGAGSEWLAGRVLDDVPGELDALKDVTNDRDEWKTQHENLLAMYQSQTAELAAARERSRWRKVSEGLPTAKCIAYYVNECGKSRTIMARYHKAKTVETSGEYDDVADYDEATDTYYLNEGWWEQIENGGDDITEWFVPDGASKITHWREIGDLPEPEPTP